MSGIDAFTRKPQTVFGPRQPNKLDLMGIRFMADAGGDGAGGDGGDKQKEGDGGDKSKDDAKYTPPASQADLDRIIGERLARERTKLGDVDQLRKDSEELKKVKAANATESEKALNDAKEAGRTEVMAELHKERVTFALDKAFAGRTLTSPSVLMDLDRSQFLRDGKVDAETVKTWVDANSTELKKESVKDAGQGKSGAGSGTSSVQSGRDLYAERHPQKK